MTIHPYTRLFSGKTSAPTVNDDISLGYEVGDIWIDETGYASYQALDVTDGAAVWLEVGGGGVEAIQDIVGAMFSGNTEVGITAIYQDGDGTIDLDATHTHEVDERADMFSDAEGNPADIGTAADGTSTYAARRDHVHADNALHHEFLPFGIYTNTLPLTATPSYPFAASIDRTLTFVRWSQAWHVATTNDGSNYWTITLKDETGPTTIKSFNTSAGAVNTWTLNQATTFDSASSGISDIMLFIECSKTGSPGPLYLGGPNLEVTG